MEQQIDIPPDSKLQRWGALASFLLAINFIVPSWIYLVGDLRTIIGPIAYDIADFLFGPVWSASLVTMVFAFREKISEHAPRRMSLALPAALLAAGAMVSVAFIRSSNRHYHIVHPELNLENSMPVLVVWTTLVAGLTAAGWHFLGWAQILIGSSGWTSHRLPRSLSLLYLAAGVVSLFIYLIPSNEGLAILLGMIISIWHGILFWKARPNE